ncbi:MAG: ATP-binding protein [Actinomycetota bacterium]|nr:ATP-binding protein [Actinomycetota bacterium]
MSRVPIRLRLTAAFGLAMAVVLAATGFLLYHRLGTSLDRTLEQSLNARAADVTALVKQADTGLAESTTGTGFAQILDSRGKIFDQTPGLARKPLLTPEQVARAQRGQLLVGRTHRTGESVRLLAKPVSAQGQRLVVVVGTPLETRDDALATLRTELLVGGPMALLLASLAGYLLAGAALRPVERMRTRAAEISGKRLSERLPVPPSHDEVSRLGETLNEMLARLETALERERSFVADASHELRTPLAHLQAEVELALESPRKREELEAALRAVGSETDRLSQLAADLLLLARMDEGALPIRLQDVQLGDLLEGVAARFERRASESGRVIETQGRGQAHLDRLRIEQAIGNLVENALRYGAGTIRISASQDGDSLEFRVTDEGPGFPPGFAPHAFERFSRAEQSRTSGGAGLGLGIVSAIAQAHSGSAAVSDARGGGAEVSIRVPNPSRNDRDGDVSPESSESVVLGRP